MGICRLVCWAAGGLFLSFCPRLAEQGLSACIGFIAVVLLAAAVQLPQILKAQLPKDAALPARHSLCPRSFPGLCPRSFPGVFLGSIFGPLLAGVVFNASVFYWSPRVLSTFGEISFWMGLLLSALLFIAAAVQFILFAELSCYLNRGGVLSRLQLAIPISWCLIELFWPQPIPWKVGTGFSHPMISPLARFVGVSGISFIVCWMASLTVSIFLDLTARRLVRRVILGRLLMLLVVGCGSIYAADIAEKMAIDSMANAQTISVGVVQGNLDPIKDFRPEKLAENLRRYQTLTAQLFGDHEQTGSDVSKEANRPQLVIWPESSVGISYKLAAKTISRGGPDDPAPGLNVPLIFGGQTLLSNSSNLRGEAGRAGSLGAYHSSIYALRTDGGFESVYHKQVLLPLSERSFLGSDFFFPRPVQIEPAEKQQNISLSFSKAIVPQGKLAIAAVICFEDLWPNIFRDLLREGDADFLLVVSNDNWFLDSRASLEHAWNAQWRAVEFGKYFLRVTNNGFTVLYSPIGLPVVSLERFKPEAKVIAVPLIRGMTGYATYGDTPMIICMFLLLLVEYVGSTRYSGSSAEIRPSMA